MLIIVINLICRCQSECIPFSGICRTIKTIPEATFNYPIYRHPSQYSLFKQTEKKGCKTASTLLAFQRSVGGSGRRCLVVSFPHLPLNSIIHSRRRERALENLAKVVVHQCAVFQWIFFYEQAVKKNYDETFPTLPRQTSGFFV